MRRRLLLAGALAPVLPALGTPPATDQPVVDWPAIALLDGRVWSPASWRQQPAVVVVWATYCGFCRRHNAHIDRLHRDAPGLRVLGVALDGDAEAVRRYMAQQGHGFAVALDQGQLRQRLTSRRSIPMTCLLDRQGRLRQAIPGEMAEADVLGLARQLLPAGA
ncbi:MAG: TlpA disulfide reductase family protein [Pseudomonadota bacterium]